LSRVSQGVYLVARGCWWRGRRTNLGGVVGGTKNQLGGAIVPGADVRDIGLVFDENLGAAKITQLQNARRWVQQEVLGLDIPMADALRVDVGERAEELVNVQLDLEDGHDRLQLVEVARGTVDRLGDEFEDEI